MIDNLRSRPVPAALRGRRWSPVTAVLGGVLVVGVLVGGTAYAAAPGANHPTAPGLTQPARPGSSQPGASLPVGANRSVGAVTTVSSSSVTVHTDAGLDVTVALGTDTVFRTKAPTPPPANSTPPPANSTPPPANSTPPRPQVATRRRPRRDQPPISPSVSASR